MIHEEPIGHLMQRVCYLFPDPFDKLCDALIIEYSDVIIDCIEAKATVCPASVMAC